MILLSALLASLTGLVAGERPAEPARMEMSAAVAAVEQGVAAIRATIRPAAVRPRAAPESLRDEHGMPRVAYVLAPRSLLSLKQSWLK